MKNAVDIFKAFTTGSKTEYNQAIDSVIARREFNKAKGAWCVFDLLADGKEDLLQFCKVAQFDSRGKSVDYVQVDYLAIAEEYDGDFVINNLGYIAHWATRKEILKLTTEGQAKETQTKKASRANTQKAANSTDLSEKDDATVMKQYALIQGKIKKGNTPTEKQQLWLNEYANRKLGDNSKSNQAPEQPTADLTQIPSQQVEMSEIEKQAAFIAALAKQNLTAAQMKESMAAMSFA